MSFLDLFMRKTNQKRFGSCLCSQASVRLKRHLIISESNMTWLDSRK